MRKIIAYLVVFFILSNIAIASGGMFRKVITFYSSEGLPTDIVLKQTGLTYGLTEPPTIYDKKPTSCTMRDFSGEIVQTPCKGLMKSSLYIKLCNDEDVYLKANVVDCNSQERISGPYIIGPKQCETFECPEGHICKIIYTKWGPCGGEYPKIGSPTAVVKAKECVPMVTKRCVGNQLIYFDSCGKISKVIKCAFGCAGNECKPLAIKKKMGECGDGWCSPPFETCETCPQDCGECLKQEEEMTLPVKFPIFTILLFVLMLVLIISITRKSRR